MIELVAEKTSESVHLEKLPALVGQGRETGVCVEETPAGSLNCLISQVEDHLVVWDLGGGLIVNGAHVPKAILGAGDTLRLGGVDFKVKYEQPAKRYVWGLRC